jgi:hypothetical protein
MEITTPIKINQIGCLSKGRGYRGIGLEERNPHLLGGVIQRMVKMIHSKNSIISNT